MSNSPVTNPRLATAVAGGLAALGVFAFLALGAARTPQALSALDVPVASGTASTTAAATATPASATPTTATATPSPASATPTPFPTAEFQGQPCGPGQIINGFLVVQSPPPVSAPTCVEAATGTGAEKLYRLDSIPAGLSLQGIQRDDSHGQSIVRVVYVSSALPNDPAITIELDRDFEQPDYLSLRDASIVSPAGFLPQPGVSLNDQLPGGLRQAIWHEPGGRYSITIKPQNTSLTLQDVAGLLEPFSPAPVAPNTGSGNGSRNVPWGIELAGTLLVGASLIGTLQHRRRRRASR